METSILIQGRAAFEALSPRLAEAGAGRTVTVNITVASSRIQQVAKYIAADDEARGAFAALPEMFFDQRHVDDLPTMGQALAYVDWQLQQARALKDKRSLPAALVARAQALRERMLTCAAYMLQRDAEATRLIVRIQEGQGYADLINDLAQLLGVYESEEWGEQIARDPVNYQPEDAAEASALIGTLQAHLDASQRDETPRWISARDQLWALVVESYSEVQEAARWMWRRSPARLVHFPSLFRSQRRRKTSAAPPDASAQPSAPPLEGLTVDAMATLDDDALHGSEPGPRP